MGELTKDDIIYILSNTKRIIEDLNQTLQTNFDSKIKSKLTKYLNKINYTYLYKVKMAVSNTVLKFSTILSENSFKILESKMFFHYDKLEKYVYNFSNYLNNTNYDLINSIKQSSNFLQNIIDFTYDKILIIHNMFIKIIENKYTSITSEEFNNFQSYKNTSFSKNKEINADYNIKEKFEEIFMNIKEDNKKLINKIIDIGDKIKEDILEELINNFIKLDDKQNEINNNNKSFLNYNAEVSLIFKDFIFENFETPSIKEICQKNFKREYPLDISLGFFPELQFRIIPLIDIKSCSLKGLEFESGKKENETNIIEDSSLSVTTNVKLEIGFYFPVVPSDIELSFAIGINGTLGSGKIGIRDTIVLSNKNKNNKIGYYEYREIQMNFYLKFIKFSFEFYILNKKLDFACKKCEGIDELLKLK